MDPSSISDYEASKALEETYRQLKLKIYWKISLVFRYWVFAVVSINTGTFLSTLVAAARS